MGIITTYIQYYNYYILNNENKTNEKTKQNKTTKWCIKNLNKKKKKPR